MAREGPAKPVPELALQRVWHEQRLPAAELRSLDGHTLRIVSPGWWNRGEGPDFRGAQIEFNGRLFSGDVEIHLTHLAWTQHGHDADPRYNNVVLVAVLEPGAPAAPPVTAYGRRIPVLSLAPYLDVAPGGPKREAGGESGPPAGLAQPGRCATLAGADSPRLLHWVCLAGEWRILNKARALSERMEGCGANQALYEAFMVACSYGPYKDHFEALARQFPYDRVRQLARQDPVLLEAACFQVAGLLPRELPPDAPGAPHFARLDALRAGTLAGLRSLPLTWGRAGVRPHNRPERRLAGAVRFLARTAEEGLAETLQRLWAVEARHVERRRSFEALWPGPMGFWASHCTWTGALLKRPAAPLGAGRVRSIIGNVFIPAGLAAARQMRDRLLEERVLAFFHALPQEPANRVLRVMKPRIFGPETRTRVGFRVQQGLIQMYQDWCETNPSCRNCFLPTFLEGLGSGTAPGTGLDEDAQAVGAQAPRARKA